MQKFRSWLDDDVYRIRIWGTDDTFSLSHEQTLHGTHAGIVEGKHAVAGAVRIVEAPGGWTIEGLAGGAALRIDSARAAVVPLVPGLTFELGEYVLVAESERSVALRRFLQRLVGWGPHELSRIDRGMQAVRRATAGRGTLVLSGDGDLTSIARVIHRYTVPNGPFVESSPRRGATSGSAWSTRNHPIAEEAWAAAVSGTLCVSNERRPKRLATLLPRQDRSTTRVQLIVCACAPIDPVLSDSIAITPVAHRSREELDRVISEYGRDASEELQARLTPLGITATFTAADHAWVRLHAASSYTDIARATLRLVALRAFEGTTLRAARILGMSAAALSEWRARRRLPDYQ